MINAILEKNANRKARKQEKRQSKIDSMVFMGEQEAVKDHNARSYIFHHTHEEIADASAKAKLKVQKTEKKMDEHEEKMQITMRVLKILTVVGFIWIITFYTIAIMRYVNFSHIQATMFEKVLFSRWSLIAQLGIVLIIALSRIYLRIKEEDRVKYHQYGYQICKSRQLKTAKKTFEKEGLPDDYCLYASIREEYQEAAQLSQRIDKKIEQDFYDKYEDYMKREGLLDE